MIYDGDERAIVLARYISETKGTVREAAKHFGISKSTVHKDVSERLKNISPSLYAEVRKYSNAIKHSGISAAVRRQKKNMPICACMACVHKAKRKPRAFAFSVSKKYFLL